MYNRVVFCYVLFLTALVLPGSGEKPYEIFIDLQNQEPGNITTNFILIEHQEYAIDVLNINSNVDFLLIQVHSYIENITLSYTVSLQTNMFTTGTNTGLVSSKTMDNSTFRINTARFFLIRQKPVYGNINILLAVSTYSKEDPIPGGCNFSFETMIAPYQKITYNDDLITVISQPPSKFGIFCDENDITTDIYFMYLKEFCNDTKEYFLGIQRMMTVESILKYGTKLRSGLGGTKFKQMYNLYRGTGRVFAVVSTLNGRSSVYVPAVSFGCNLGNWLDECIGPVGVHWKLFCAIILILGSFICFGGHRFFKAGLFTMGYIFGAILSMLLASIDDYFSAEVKAIYSLSTGIGFGILWLLLWLKFGAPLVSVQLTFLLSGTLIASVILFNQLGDLIYFTDDLTFWLVFSVIVMITLIPIFFYPSLYHIIALSLLGSYAFVVALNYYVGGNLPYILINTYRRIAVKDFRLAVIDPPYQLLDFTQTLLWALLFGLGIFVQYRHSIGKAPFPPHRAGVDFRPSVNERTPLLSPENVASPHWPEESPVNDRTPLPKPERVPPPPYQP